MQIDYPGAIYHVMSRGNLRRSVFEDERDYQCLLEGLEQTVGRFGWDLLSFMLMPNHVHLHTQPRRDWSLLDLGQATYDLVRSVATIASSERSHLFAGKIRSGESVSR
ncbi:MAG: transposase [Planctomycetaceae bacterium]|nr:transposase [Planctomycetaceae bacterium]